MKKNVELNKYLEDLKPYMLNVDVINNITSINNRVEKKKIVEKKSVRKENKLNNWEPNEKDQLFWCFYYALNGEHGYEEAHKTPFVYETKIKIDAIEKLRKKKDLLKQHNIKLSNIEQEFSTNEKTTVEGLYALCLLYNIRLLIVKKYTYIDMGITDKIDGIIEMNNQEYSLKIEEIDMNIVNNRMKIINPNKPIKGVSSYTLDNLQEIGTMLKINTFNISGKKKTKNELYQEILSRL